MLKTTLEIFLRGIKYNIAWLNTGQSCDFMPMFKSLGEKERKKINALICYTAKYGPGRNKEKWRLLETGLFEMKSGQNRAVFFYHNEVRRMIVITHLFIKKGKKCPPGEIKRALERKKTGNSIMPAKEE